MLNRWIGITCILLMLAGNAALFLHDIYPRLTAGDPPPADALSLKTDDRPHNTQVGIYLAGGKRIGTSWTQATRPGVTTLVSSITTLDSITLANEVPTPRVRIDMELNYNGEKEAVDQIRAAIHGLKIPIKLEGEFTPPNDLPCKWTVGDHTGTFIIPADSTRAIGDAIRPFNRLPGIWKGRKWRMKLFDPISQLMPHIAGDMDFESKMVEVTKENELIEHNGEMVETFVVEAPGATAWVARDGRVVRQEVVVPLIPGGKLILIDETFDQKAFRAAGSTLPPDSAAGSAAGAPPERAE